MRVGPMREQQLDELALPAPVEDSGPEGSVAEAIDCVDIRTMFEEQVRDSERSLLGGEVQWGHPGAVGRARVRASVEQRSRHVEVVVGCGIVQSRSPCPVEIFAHASIVEHLPSPTQIQQGLERETGFEPATFSLGS